MNIVLDLDETLVSVTTKPPRSRTNGGDTFNFVLSGTTYWVTKRPCLSLFLRYIFKKFRTVSVWTAATRPYAIHIIKHIFTQSQIQQLSYILTRESLKINGNGYTKPLTKLISLSNGRIKAGNTVLIDDLESTTQDNSGNGIIIPPFRGDRSDRNLPKLMIILQGMLNMAEQLDFSQYRSVFHLNHLTN